MGTTRISNVSHRLPLSPFPPPPSSLLFPTTTANILRRHRPPAARLPPTLAQTEERTLVFKSLEPLKKNAPAPSSVTDGLGTIRLEVTFGELSTKVTPGPKSFNRDFFKAGVAEDQVKGRVTERAG